jgi:DNA-binding transcriptional ArsR family regulator
VSLAPETAFALEGFEPLLQAPARLQVMAVLTQVQEAEFARLKAVTGSSDSVMSKHLGALADAGLITLRKAAIDSRQRTWASVTRSGRRRFDDHVAALHRIIASS